MLVARPAFRLAMFALLLLVLSTTPLTAEGTAKLSDAGLAGLFNEAAANQCLAVRSTLATQSQQAAAAKKEVCGDCDKWYTVNSYARKLVEDCDTATQADYDEVTQQALVNTSNFGTQVCSDLGCVHTMSGANPDVSCSCSNRILICSVNMQVYCSSP